MISAEDFFSENSSVNKTLFSLLKHGFDNGEVLDYVVLSERVKSLGISFEDNINIADIGGGNGNIASTTYSTISGGALQTTTTNSAHVP